MNGNQSPRATRPGALVCLVSNPSNPPRGLEAKGKKAVAEQSGGVYLPFFFSNFSLRFSFNDLDGFFLSSFLVSWALLTLILLYGFLGAKFDLI
jgi:hypothetical protein